MRLAAFALSALLLQAAPWARAQDAEAAGPQATPAEPPAPAHAEAPRDWEGALGAILRYGPEYPGSDLRGTSASASFFVRYRRFSISNGGGFVTRRADDVLRGVGLDLSRSERTRVGLQLRLDRGRNDGSSAGLEGLGDVRATLRARLAATWRLGGWRVGGGWSVDALGRGGGNLGDFGIAHEQRLSPDTVWNWGVTLTAAGDRYMQSYFGVTEAQAARTGYPVYDARAGLRDIALALGMRSELTPRWVAIGGYSRSRLLGPAADSPLTIERNTWGLSGGLAWRF
ncbi:MipA/OmpV family protein [Rubrivivax sp. RP6-9]|uniref:MipA/OmpV family protein n=1 Tax=Rubrivivax sp. RP6-9 TaxID=3415750 RepID=UPI003CC67899